MQTTPPATRDRWRPHAAVLALGTFAVGTDAFVIAGVLPGISRSLDVGIAAAGQLITVFSIAYAVFAPLLAALTAQWSRRVVLVTAMAVFAAGNVVTALAPGYVPVLISRVIAGAGAAMYTANASATAAMLAGRYRAKAIALVMVGLTSSLVLGAPLGTAIGTALGWRATIWFVTALGVLAGVTIAVRLPAIRPERPAGLRQRLAPLADRRVLGVLAGTVVVFTGIYIPQTYLSAVYRPATGGDGDRVAILLLVFGIAATAGNLTIGHLSHRFTPRRVLIPVALLLTALFLLLPAARGSFATAVPAIAISGALSFSVTTPQQHRIITLVRADQAPLVTSLYQSSLYLAVFLAGGIGAAGLGLPAIGPGRLPWLAAAFALGAALIFWAADRRNAADPTRQTPSTPSKTAADRRPVERIVR